LTGGTINKTERMHDLDWLRVIAIILLIFFHVGMVFISWTWYFMQDVETSPILDEATLFLSHWRMALLFLISGAGTLFALGYRSHTKYVKERFIRLLIPLLFGIFIIIPPQIYFELLDQGWVFSDYFEFSQRYFEGGLYPLGDFSWHHLWFIAYLLLYSMLGLPVFMYFRSENGKKLLGKLAKIIEPNGRIYLLMIPLMIVQVGLRDKFSGFHNLVDDMANFAYFFLFFLYGFIICSNSILWDSIQRQRRTSLIIAVSSFAVLFFARLNDFDLGYVFYWIVETVVAWTWVMAIIGYGRQYLNFKNKFLAYANEGIYPLYILHQTVLIIVAYYIIQTGLPIAAKFIIISGVTFVVCIGLYDLIIRRNNATRFLFGMKPLPDSYLKEKREAFKAQSVNFKIFERKPVNEV
jgi:glucans biosynthesis protein C